jgi:hypothetical protein
MLAKLYDAKGRLRFKDIQVTDYAEDDEGMLVVGFRGPEQAIRALWANIVKRRTARSKTPTEVVLLDGTRKFSLQVHPQNHYHQAAVGEDGMLIFRRAFNKLENSYIFGGDEETPSPYFELAMKQLPMLPYKPEWLPVIWHEAIKEELIKAPKVSRCGMTIWYINLQGYWRALWTRLVKEGLVA